MKILVSAGNAQSLMGFRLPFLRGLVSAGHEVHACAPLEDASVPARLAAEGVKFHPVLLRRAALSPLHDLIYARAVYSLVRTLGIQGYFAYTHKPICLGLPAAAAAGARVRVALITGLGYAFTAGDGLHRTITRSAMCLLYRQALPAATHIYFQNSDDLSVFTGLGLLDAAPLPQIVPGSGVPLEEFPEAPLPPPPPVFLMLSRLLADKGVREYAAAALLVKRRHPDIRCLLAGALDPNPSAVRHAEVDEWVQSGALEYLGVLQDVRPALRACTVYVLPSYREGTPRSVLEAMSTGRPILTTDAPGCRETLRNLQRADADAIRRADNGLAVPVGSASSLADAMCELVSDHEQLIRFAHASRQYAESRFDAHKVALMMVAPFA